MDLKTKILLVFGLLGSLLLFALAYNLGSTSAESKGITRLQLDRSRFELTKNRLAKCNINKKKVQDGGTITIDLDGLRAERDQLQSENDLLVKSMKNHQASLSECEEENKQERKARTGTTEHNATHVIARLSYEIMMMEQALQDVNATKTRERQALKSLLRSYRLENNELRQKIKKTEKVKDDSNPSGGEKVKYVPIPVYVPAPPKVVPKGDEDGGATE
jgi:hypothetical protein